IRNATHGYPVAGELRAARGIDNRRGHARKVAAQERWIRDTAEKWPALPRTDSLVASEDEEFVLNNRPAQCSTELVPPERRFLRSEERTCVQLVVAQKLVRRSMHTVGPRFRDRGDHRSALSVLGGESVAKYAELLDGIDRRLHGQIVEPQRPD